MSGRLMVPRRVHEQMEATMNLRHSNFEIRHSAFLTNWLVKGQMSNAECPMLNVRVHGPNSRALDVQVEALHEPH